MLVDHLQKNKEKILKFEETGVQRCIYENKLNKACFQHHMAYGNFKDLTRRTAANKLLHDKAFNIAKNLKCDGYQHELVSMVYKCFDENTEGGASKI